MWPSGHSAIGGPIIEPTLFRYILRFSWRQQVALLVLTVLSFPFLYASLELPKTIVNKAIGLNVGGKIGIARSGEHIVVAMFFGIGLLHLNEVAIALGHRVV